MAYLEYFYGQVGLFGTDEAKGNAAVSDTIIDACGREWPITRYHSRHRRRPDLTVACSVSLRHGHPDHECPLTSRRCDCRCHEGDWIDPQGALFDTTSLST